MNFNLKQLCHSSITCINNRVLYISKNYFIFCTELHTFLVKCQTSLVMWIYHLHILCFLNPLNVLDALQFQLLIWMMWTCLATLPGLWWTTLSGDLGMMRSLGCTMLTLVTRRDQEPPRPPQLNTGKFLCSSFLPIDMLFDNKFYNVFMLTHSNK